MAASQPLGAAAVEQPPLRRCCCCPGPSAACSIDLRRLLPLHERVVDFELQPASSAQPPPSPPTRANRKVHYQPYGLQSKGPCCGCAAASA
eukprot:5359623-Alexandrium_andersonii.AAC.1